MAEGYDWPALLGRLMAHDDLSRGDAYDAMSEVMSGRATPAQIAAFIVSTTAKGETVAEMTGFVDAMYDAAVTVEIEGLVVDLVGTGGDRAGTFNISTTAAFVAAGAGVRIAKHGNRAASSQTGSADLLAAFGIPLDMSPAETVRMVEDIGFGFFFAPHYHPAMRHAGPVRRELGVRTVFNYLGPLCHPANVKHTTIGVSNGAMADKMIRVLANRGTEAAFVYYGEDGLDEMTLTGPSFIYRLRDGEITTAEFTPEDFGVPRAAIEALAGGDAATNVEITRAVLGGKRGAHRDVVMINAAPAIVVAGLADGFVEAMELAAASIDSGAAEATLQRAIEFAPAPE